MKRFWSLVLACSMILALLPVGAAAGDVETIASGGTAYFDWVLDSQGVLTVEGYTIPDYAFPSNMPWYDYRDQIRKVVLVSSSSISIGSNAFYGCSNLETVELPQQGCSKIGASAFANCSALKKMVLWDHGISMTVGSGAFIGCTGLETLGIPHYATLESNAFASCVGLSDIYITSSYTQTFSGWDAAEDSFDAVTAVVHYPTGMAISSYIGNKSYGAELTWTETAEGFCGNHTIWTYDETAQVLTISGSGSPAAFLSGSYTPWTNLRSDVAAIVVEEGITELPSYLFEHLSAATQVQLPDTLTLLAPNAFNDCSALNDLYIPRSVKAFFADTDFNRCTALTDLYYHGTEEEWGKVENGADAITDAMTLHTLALQSATATCTESGAASHYRFDDYASGGAYPGYYDLDKQPIGQPETIPALGHKWDEGTVTTDATCTAEGEKTYTCQNDANHTKTEVIPMTGHTDEDGDRDCDNCGTAMCDNHVLEYHATKQPTCTEDGYVAHWHCAACDRYFDDQAGQHETNAQDIRLQGGDHSPVTDAAVAPTCTETGLTEGSHCGLCGEILTAQTQVPMVDHSWQSTTDVFTQQCSSCKTDRTITLTGSCGLYGEAEPIWTLTSDGTLTISGAGDMANYTYSPYQEYILRVVIEEGVTSTDAAFQNFTNLVSAVLPDSMTNVNQLTFCGCTSLTQVDLGEGVTSLQLGTFSGCSALKTLDIPDSVTYIEETTFGGCSALETLTIGSGIREIDPNTFSGCTNLKTVTIDTYEEAVTIGENAFHENTEVIFLRKKPASLVFDGGSGTVDDPYRVSNAQQLDAVRDYPTCHYVQTADIDLSGMDWTPIGMVYQYCEEGEAVPPFAGSYNGQDYNITGMTITGEYSIDSKALHIGLFGGTENASISNVHLSGGEIDITVNAGASALCMGHIGGIAGSGATITNCTNANPIQVTVMNPDRSGEPFYIGGIGGFNNGVSGCVNTGNITVVSEQSGVMVGGISGRGAVQTSWNCGSVSVDSGTYDSVGGIVGELTSGVLHQCCNTGTVQGAEAGGIAGKNFGTIENCFNTGTVTAAKAAGIVSYQRGTVTKCYNAGDVTGGGAYPVSAGISYDNNTTSVTQVYYLDNVTAGTISGNDVGTMCSSRQLMQQSTFENFDFQYIWKIEPTADYPYPTLLAVEAELPEIQRRWGTCGDNAFWQLDENGKLTISGTGDMYYYAAGTRPWEAYCDEVLSIVLEEGITGAGGSAFYNCVNATAVSLPSTLTSMGSFVFQNCDALTEIVLPEGLVSVGDSVFCDCDNLKTAAVPGTVITWGDYFFWDCTALENVTLGEGLTIIPAYMFSGCTALESLEIPDSVTEIRRLSFEKCGLKTVNIGSGIQYIRSQAFEHCTALKTAYIDQYQPLVTVEAGAFDAGVTVIFKVCAQAHSWGAGGCTDVRTCTICGTVEEQARGHQPVTDAAVVPTCTESGLTEGSHCGVCGEILTVQENLPAAGHNAVTDAAVAPTCTESGLTEGSHCGVCGEILTAQENLPAAGHQPVTDAAVAPTCTESGLTEGSHCGVCGEILTAQESLPAAGHQPVTDAAVAPTCTESGLTEGSHCGVCGEILTAQENLPAAGHSWDEGKVTLAPTCQTAGIKTFTCQNDSSHTTTETLAIVSHGDQNHDGKCDHCQQVTGYTVTFVTNGGAPVPEAQLVAPGGFLSEPEAPQRENYTFRGWFLEGEDGERWKFDQYTVDGDLTLYAKWHKVKHNVHGYVHKHGGGKPDHKVKVYLQQGGKTICELETDEHGFYQMEGIPAGCYNLMVKAQDGRTRTTLVEIWEDGQMEMIELPEHNVSTEIQTSGEAQEAILVNGLDQVADSSADGGGHHVKVTMKVGKTEDLTERLPETEEEKAKKKAQEAIKEQAKEDDDDREYVFLDIEIEKQIQDGEHTEITDTDGLLEIRVPVETHGRRHFKVYRHHGDQVHELGEKHNEHGEYIEIHEGYVIIHARKFSTYAVTSLAADQVCQHDFQTRYVWTEQGCDVIRDCKYCEEQQEEPVTFTKEGGMLKLSAVPDGLTLMVAAYDDDGQMTGCQLMTRLQLENPIAVSGKTVKVFLLNSAFAPRTTAK